jgi:hypothetical protein
MDTFYARLFATAPAVKPLFAGTDLRRPEEHAARHARSPAQVSA